MSEQPGPTRAELDAWFTGLVDGSQTRDAAVRWSVTWLHLPAAIYDEVIWWAIGLLCGIDLKSGPDRSLIHDDDQVRQRQLKFRRRCAASLRAEN